MQIFSKSFFLFDLRSAVEEFGIESDRDVEEKLARLARKQVRKVNILYANF